jgi:hypothetical protein
MRGLRRRGISEGQRLHGYHVAGLAEKQALTRAPWRRPETRCLDCLIVVDTAQLAAHRAKRCPGEPVVGRDALAERKRPCR